MKVGITGAGGFIGKNYINYLLENTNDDIIAGFHNQSEFVNNDRVENEKIELTEPDTLDCFQYSDILIHAGGLTNHEQSFEEPEKFIQVNTIGTLNILRKCSSEDMPIIYLSTCHVMDKINNIIDPINPYGFSKYGGEFFIKNYEFGTIARLINPFGPYQNENKLIPTAINKAKNDEEITIIKGNGRQWIYIKDVIRAIELIRDKERFSDIFNIAPRECKSTRLVIQYILDKMSKQYLLNVKDPKGKSEKSYYLGPSKIYQLGWSPLYSLEEGLDETIKFFGG